ncbi:MAG: hypothetical protein KKF80_02500, partial [Candidatus Omnitrophica bacterium]|nr:hypothetical protein [Candidatus Omnitrophota bacterium]
TNICIRLPMEMIKKQFPNKDKYKATHMIVNMESGNFNKHLPMTEYDTLLDSQSTNPNEHWEEKMVSGLYLGELMRLTLRDLAAKGIIFGGRGLASNAVLAGGRGTPWILKKYQRFATKYVSDIEALDLTTIRSLWKMRWIMKKLFVSRADARTIQEIAHLIATRSARVAATVIAASIMAIDPELTRPHTVAVDGSVFEKHYKYQDRMREVFTELFGEKASQITMKLTHDGSGVGAGIIAAVASKAQETEAHELMSSLATSEEEKVSILNTQYSIRNTPEEPVLALASSAVATAEVAVLQPAVALKTRHLRDISKNTSVTGALIKARAQLDQIEAAVADTATVQQKLARLAEQLVAVSQAINTIPEEISLNDQEAQLYKSLMLQKSRLARDLAGLLITAGNTELLKQLTDTASVMMEEFLKGQVEKGKTKAEKADATLTTTKKFLSEWLDPANNIPSYMIQGIYRGMLEGRSEDLMFSFKEWKEFGTAGIREKAMQSSFGVVQELEIEEFAKNPYASVLPGPNLFNAVTLLQQEAAIVKIIRDLAARVAADDASVKDLPEEFKRNIKNNRVTVAYDSRLNGEYFAKVLATAFLRDGIKVDLFDNAAGVPHLAWAANREASVFGFLISASHSEANYNGFKAFLGHQMSQVDKASKTMIISARDKVSYQDMHLDLTLPTTDLEAIIASTGTLRWIGADSKKEGKEYHNRELVSFYPWYYRLVKDRSPLALLDSDARARIEQRKATNPLDVLYTAFFGVGAKPAADFKGFLNKEAGYQNVDTVSAQTDVMDGRFPGHNMPDPGIPAGWVSNLWDYFKQYAGDDLTGLEKAIAAFNSKEVGIATDPDIDRAGMMISLPEGVIGNIKDALIKRIEQELTKQNKPLHQINKITATLSEELRDKLLLTANDAWTFMVYWMLHMMEENKKLERDRVYLILKSHVTTLALERVAKLFRDKGYQVYVVDTYVGFTEIGKKGRDVFTLAKLAWDIHKALVAAEDTSALRTLLKRFSAANAELKANVPYQNAGVAIIDETQALLEALLSGDQSNKEKLLNNLNALSLMTVITGVEESNGYGELGRWNRKEEKVELNHISDKDGSLAAFKFLEILSYGDSIGKQPYDMYKDLIRAIGYVYTINSALYHPGLTGVEEKTNELEALEKTLAYAIQRALDKGETVTFFDGRYTVEKVEVYRDAKYDTTYKGFPEEGIRLYLKTKAGSDAIVTYRPSGTGDSNRDYNWLLGRQMAEGEDIEEYRRAITEETDLMDRDFYGLADQSTGYIARTHKDFYGLLSALKEAGLNKQLETLGKIFPEGTITLSKEEEALKNAVSAYAFAARDRAKDTEKLATTQTANRAAWKDYLTGKAASEFPDAAQLSFTIKGTVITRVPKAAVIAWLPGLIDYLSSLIEEQKATLSDVSFPDAEVMDLLAKRMSEENKAAVIEETKTDSSFDSAQDKSFDTVFDQGNMDALSREYFKTLYNWYMNPATDRPALIINTGDNNANFHPSARLTAEQREELLGAKDYASIRAEIEKETTQPVYEMHLNSLDAGLGTNVERARYIKEKFDRDTIGAKGTDLSFEGAITINGKDYLV